MAEDKIVLPTGEKAGPVVTTDSELANPAHPTKAVRLDTVGDRPLYAHEVDPAKQVGPARDQQPEPKKVKSTRRK